ncbi:MAG: hypothetical protein GYA12_04720 [Chloroflexi bacterium]|nr:hypothetical protein [Chloroflexota bacterium]
MKELQEAGNHWQEVESELNTARLARSQGNEGKARVCARRAAGKALNAVGVASGPPLAAIRFFLETQSMPDEVRVACTHLIATVNDSYQMDDGIDLIADAEMIWYYVNSAVFLSKKHGIIR